MKGTTVVIYFLPPNAESIEKTTKNALGVIPRSLIYFLVFRCRTSERDGDYGQRETGPATADPGQFGHLHIGDGPEREPRQNAAGYQGIPSPSREPKDLTQS